MCVLPATSISKKPKLHILNAKQRGAYFYVNNNLLKSLLNRVSCTGFFAQKASDYFVHKSIAQTFACKLNLLRLAEHAALIKLNV